MTISILTLFPNLFTEFLKTSIVSRAQKKQKVTYRLVNIRDFGAGKHQVVDGRPYGGGAGMVIRADILEKTLLSTFIPDKTQKVVLLSASGTTFNQAKARQLASIDHLILVCGRYEGVDQRFIDQYVDDEISIGDFVLTGGEIPSMVIVESVIRLLPGVLEKDQATVDESHTNNLLEYPHYTRPEIFKNQNVPDVLRSGHHAKVEQWKREQSLEKTKKVRPDLMKKVQKR